MPLEIERRFLPKEKNWRPEGDAEPITQGYFKLGEGGTKASVQKWPWPSFWLNGERLTYLGLADYKHLLPLLNAEGEVPAGWKARIRCYFGVRYVLDLKGPRTGTTRFELAEKPLSEATGKRLLALCGDTILQKKRYTLPYRGHAWQVDVYEGQHAGLITCEVELPSPTSIVQLPPWVGEEITDRKLFGNT